MEFFLFRKMSMHIFIASFYWWRQTIQGLALNVVVCSKWYTVECSITNYYLQNRISSLVSSFLPVITSAFDSKSRLSTKSSLAYYWKMVYFQIAIICKWTILKKYLSYSKTFAAHMKRQIVYKLPVFKLTSDPNIGEDRKRVMS